MRPASSPLVLNPAQQLLKRLTTIKAKEPKLTVGLDIGSTSIKVIGLGARKGLGGRPVIGQSLITLSEGVEVSEAIKQAIGAIKVPVRSVNLSVRGQWVVRRIVELPSLKPAEMKQALPFEAQRYLPFNIQDVVIDGVVLGPSDAQKTWVLIVACKKELIDRRLDGIKRAGLDATLIDVDALALANALLSGANGHRAEETRVLINVGAQFTNLLIFKGDIPYLVRDIPWGAEKLCRSASDQLGLDVAAVSKTLTESTASPELQNALKLATEMLVTELQLSFDYFENRFGQPPEQLLISGGLGQSALFIDVLKSHLSQTVTSWTPVRGLSAQFAIAYGLALRTD